MLKRTTEEVAKYFEENGCVLLGEYTGAMDKMMYQCSCGEISEMSWNNFTKGKRCGHCAKYGQKKKRSVEQVQKIFADRGAKFLDNEFKGVHHNHNYICKCGYKSVISFAGFYHQQQDCKKCAIQKRSGPNNHGWIVDREQKRLNHLFRKKCYKALSSSLKATNQDKVGHTSDIIGYGPKELQEHVKKHPNWKNVKDENWQLDHIFPIDAFIEHEIRDLSLINHLDNLRPVTQFENYSKHNKYNKSEFFAWLKKHGINL